MITDVKIQTYSADAARSCTEPSRAESEIVISSLSRESDFVKISLRGVEFSVRREDLYEAIIATGSGANW